MASRFGLVRRKEGGENNPQGASDAPLTASEETRAKVEAAKAKIENMYKVQNQNIQERLSRALLECPSHLALAQLFRTLAPQQKLINSWVEGQRGNVQGADSQTHPHTHECGCICEHYHEFITATATAP
eukprot:scaffold33772_cov20-Tisochrysis_lutea.AAC.2